MLLTTLSEPCARLARAPGRELDDESAGLFLDPRPRAEDVGVTRLDLQLEALAILVANKERPR